MCRGEFSKKFPYLAKNLINNLLKWEVYYANIYFNDQTGT